MVSFDQIKNICALQEKIPKLNYIHLKVFFGHVVQTLAFFHVKHVHIFVLVDYTIFSTLKQIH